MRGGEVLPVNATIEQINAYLDLCADEDIEREIKEEVETHARYKRPKRIY